MAPESRRPDPALADTLFDESYRFEFFQAVRLLERWRPERACVGREAKPGDEVVRFATHTSLSFPPSAIWDLTRPEGDDSPALMSVAFMGLTGALGPLPRHYSELLLERVRRKDFALRDFLDVFNHRLISLFLRAWEKYRLPIGYERAVREAGGYDPITMTLFADLGMATPGLRKRLAVDETPLQRFTGRPAGEPRQQVEDDTLLFYAGLLADHRRPALALEGLLADYFEVPVRVEQLVGRWLELDEESRACLGSAGKGRPPRDSLGEGTVLGSRVWDQHAAFAVHAGPMPYARFCQLLPSGPDFVPMAQLVQFFAGQEYDFDLRLTVLGWEVLGCRLGAPGPLAPRLGWSTWLKSPDRLLGRDPDDTVLGPHLTRIGGLSG